MLDYLERMTFRRRNEDGASAVEYGLLVAAIAAIIVVVVFVLGGFRRTAFQGTCEEIGTNDASADTDAGDCAG